MSSNRMQLRMTPEQITAMMEEANRADNEQPCGECGSTEQVTKNVYPDGSKGPFFLCRECYFSGLGPADLIQE